MKIWNGKELKEALKKVLLQDNLQENLELDEVVIDSRKIIQDSIFLALKGENNDGHDFLEQAFIGGAKVAIIHEKELFLKYKDKFALALVDDSFKALYELAKYKRANSVAKIIAVTGSAGKTSVKEMLKLVFASQGKTYATQGNLNNHIGLPLTIANMPQNTEFAVFEMGMNHLNEINVISDLAQPDVAIITNVAPAHIGNFNNEEEIALAKSEIFSGLSKKNGFVIINHDNKYYSFLKNSATDFYKIDQKRIVSFGQNFEANYRLEEAEISSASEMVVKVAVKDQIISYKIGSSNKISAFNSLIALACLDLIGKDLQKGLDSLVEVKAIAGRGTVLEVRKNNKNLVIIDDSYNANIASIAAGIEYLSDLKNNLKKTRSIAVLGDMLELGADSKRLHAQIAQYLQKFKIDFALLAGGEMKYLAAELGDKNCKLYKNSDDLAQEIESLLQDGDIILVKGSRGMKMEKCILSLNAS